MLRFSALVPALGVDTARSGAHDLWWLLLVIVAVAVVTPGAYLFSRDGGRPQHRQ